MRISDWSSDVCSSDLTSLRRQEPDARHHQLYETGTTLYPARRGRKRASKVFTVDPSSPRLRSSRFCQRRSCPGRTIGSPGDLPDHRSSHGGNDRRGFAAGTARGRMASPCHPSYHPARRLPAATTTTGVVRRCSEEAHPRTTKPEERRVGKEWVRK